MFYATICFGLAALGGITMAAMMLSGKARPPMILALGHGVLVISGFVFLLRARSVASLPQLGEYALYALIAAALGGLAMFILFHLRNKPLPTLLVLGHGAIALTGLGMLITAYNRLL